MDELDQILASLNNVELAVTETLVPSASGALRALSQGNIQGFQDHADKYVAVLEQINNMLRPVFGKIRQQGISETPLPTTRKEPLEALVDEQIASGLDILANDIERAIANINEQYQ